MIQKIVRSSKKIQIKKEDNILNVCSFLATTATKAINNCFITVSGYICVVSE